MPFSTNFSTKWPPHSYPRTSYPSGLKMYVCPSCWASGVPTPLTAQEHGLQCATFHLKRHLQKKNTKMQNVGLPLLIHTPQNLVRTSRNSLKKKGKHVCWAIHRQSVCWAKIHLRLCKVTSHSGLLC